MKQLINTLAAAAASILLATGALAQSTVVPIDNEPAPRLIVEQPLPGPLARGVVFIPYRVENLRILPLGGATASKVSPRVGHLHITIDDLLYVAQAQQVGARRINLQRHDLAPPDTRSIQVMWIPKGTTAPRHSHPGEEYHLCFSKVRGNTRWRASRRWSSRPEKCVHSSRNRPLGKDRRYRPRAQLATYIVEKGKPLLTVVK